jgi:hypothetical protein
MWRSMLVKLPALAAVVAILAIGRGPSAWLAAALVASAAAGHRRDRAHDAPCGPSR